MYINDIVNDIGSNIRLFADDTSLFIIVDDPVTAAGCINADLDRISNWDSTWLVTFNPSKTETSLISRKLIHLFLSKTIKHLGLYFSNDCTWHQHINHITVKAWARINIMRKLKFKLNRKSLETICTAFIRPLIENGDIIWDNCSRYKKQELDKIQNEAARRATGAIRLVSIRALCKEIGWCSLEKRRSIHKLNLFDKMTHNLAPLYISFLVPQSVSNISRYNLRNSNNLQTIDARSTLYYNSFLPSTVRAWNNVNDEVKQSYSLNTFKGFLSKDKLLVPKHFYVGHREVQVLHTGLRTNCSSFKVVIVTDLGQRQKSA